MKKYLISFSIIFILTFNTFVPNFVFANTYTPVIDATPELVKSVKYIVPALVSVAPEIAFVACVTLGAGYVYENREEVITMAGGLYQDLKNAGYSIVRTASGGLALGTAGLEFLKTRIGQISTSGTQAIPFTAVDGMPILDAVGMSIPNGTVVKGFQGTGNVFNFTATSAGLIGTYLLYSGNLFWFSFLPAGTSPYNTSIFNGTLGTVLNYNTPVGTSICVNPKYPSQVFKGNITGNIGGQVGTYPRSVPIPYVPDVSIPIPATLPLDVSGTSDWVGDMVGTSDITKAFPASVPVVVPVTPAITDTSIPTDGSLNWKPLEIASSKFPFCIPFDLINLYKPFSGDRVAPKWTINFPKVYGMQESSFVYDFSKMDKFATLLRYFILISFCYGLIVKTKTLIK